MLGDFRSLVRPKIRISSVNSSGGRDDSSELAPRTSGRHGAREKRDLESWDVSMAEIFVLDPKDVVLEDLHTVREAGARSGGQAAGAGVGAGSSSDAIDKAIDEKASGAIWPLPELTDDEKTRLRQKQGQALDSLKQNNWMFTTR